MFASSTVSFHGPQNSVPAQSLQDLKYRSVGALSSAWWNPAVEDQATDRCHRLGQRRPVSVARFVAAGTIEEKMAEMQDLKRKLIEVSMGVGGVRSKAAMQQLRMEMVSRLIE